MAVNLYPHISITSGAPLSAQNLGTLARVIFPTDEWSIGYGGGGTFSGGLTPNGMTPTQAYSRLKRVLLYYRAKSSSSTTYTAWFWITYVAKSATTFEVIRWCTGDTSATESPYTGIKYGVRNNFGTLSLSSNGLTTLTDKIASASGTSNGSATYALQLTSNIFGADSGAITSATLTRYHNAPTESDTGGSLVDTTTLSAGSSVTKYWVYCSRVSFKIEATAASGIIGIGLEKNGVLIAKGRERFSVSVGSFSAGDVFQIVKLNASDVCLPIFGDIQDATHRPLFADITQATHLPLFAMLVGNIMTYIQGHSSHLWTRITLTSSPSGDAVSDDVFPGRDTSRYDGSSSTKQTAVSVSLSELAALATASSSGDLVVTLYFHCALCNWGCMGDIEEYEVDFVVFWKHFAMTVKKSTASNPGPGSEYFAFSFTVTLSEQNGAYYVKEVAITTKDGATY